MRYGDYHQTIGRLGARLDRSWTDDSNRQYTPYLRANYYKGWGGTAQTSVSAADNPALGASFSSGNFGQMWEVGAGGTVTLQQDVSLCTPKRITARRSTATAPEAGVTTSACAGSSDSMCT